MKDNSGLPEMEISVDTDHVKIFTLEGSLFVTLTEQSYGRGFCIVHSSSGHTETIQGVSKGENKIKHSFAKGQYLITLSLGPEMISKKVEIK